MGPFVSLTHSPPQQPRAAPEGSGRKEGKENRQANKHKQNRGSRRAIDLTIPFSRNRRSVFGTAVSILTVPYVSFERRRIFSMAGMRVLTECDSFPGVCEVIPRTCDVVPGNCDVVPGSCGVVPGTCGAVPDTCGVVPGTCGVVAGTRDVLTAAFAASLLFSASLR